MAKYTWEFKLEVVAEFLSNHESTRSLARKYDMDESIVRNWIGNFKAFGINGLKPRHTATTYSTEFKLHALQLHLEDHLSYRQVANQIGLNNPRLIANWMRAFRERGISELSQRPGRPPTMKKEKKKALKHQMRQGLKTKKIDGEEWIPKETYDQTIAKNRELEIENAFLKELRRLQEQEKKPPIDK